MSLRKIIVVLIFIIPLIVFLLYYWNKRENAIENNIYQKYSRKSAIYKSKDTLVLNVQFLKIESKNYPSMIILRDLIYFDNYSDLINTDAYFFKFCSLDNLHNEDSIFTTILTKNELTFIYNLHKSCKTLLETKKYIFENCSADWVGYGNEFIIHNLKYNYLYGKIKYATGSPDIISLMTGYASDWCSHKTTERREALLYLEHLKKTEPEWEKIWPGYGNHIENILKY